MKKLFKYNMLLAALFCFNACANNTSAEAPKPHINSNQNNVLIAKNIVQKFGKLSISGNRIVNQDGKPVSLSGVSYFWSTTGWTQDRFYNENSVNYFVSDWNASLVRAAISAQGKGSILDDPSNMKKAEAIIDAAIKNGIYVLVDWHSHHAENNTKEAVAFFDAISKKYAGVPNIIYEIYNEPLNNVSWSNVVKPYSLEVIAAIRKNDPDNLIIVGTPTWSQDVDIAAQDPITGFKNIAYTMHFYAGTHKEGLRTKTQTALDKGLAIFVTEWGTINANGDGAVDYASTNTWFEFMNKHCLSNANWAVSDKNETASIFKSGTPSNGPYSDKDLTTSGVFVKSLVKTGTKICE